MKKWIPFVFCLLLAPVSLQGQSNKKLEKEFRSYVHTLAGEEFAGRAAQTQGDTLTSKYLRDFLAAQKGVRLLYDNGIQNYCKQAWFSNVCSFNVVGFIEGNDPVLKNEIIVLGAHYDHMGLEAGAFGEEPAVKYGADDNASGTAMVMALTKQMAKERKKLKRSVVIAFFGAEERGLIGSNYMAQNLPEGIDPENIACMVNFDMVGRLTPKRGLIFFGLGSGMELSEYVRSIPTPFIDQTPVIYNESMFSASDHSSFYEIGVPAFMMMTGIHSDYHKAGDTPDKINYYGMAQIYRYARDVIHGLTNGKQITYNEKAEK